MILFSPIPVSKFVPCVDCQATVARLIGNISGFVYRRRHDARWTMDFVSEGCRDVTGYDPHRFLANQSLAFADLIARADWKRVNDQVRIAAQHRRHIVLEYLIRAAHGAWVLVEDRLTPVVNAAGTVLAVEGVMDRARRAVRVTAPATRANARAAADAAHLTIPNPN
jgi:PAS domain-containing protein